LLRWVRPKYRQLQAAAALKRCQNGVSNYPSGRADTRKFFELPDAIGVVVMLNEHAPLIEPDYFQDKAWDMLRKELAPGQLRYPENQVVILISEAHRVVNAANVEMIPVETSLSEAGVKNPAAEAFAIKLRQRWVDFNQAIASDWIGPIRDVTTRGPAPLFIIRA
jgi:hypothetical protein